MRFALPTTLKENNELARDRDVQPSVMHHMVTMYRVKSVTFLWLSVGEKTSTKKAHTHIHTTIAHRPATAARHDCDWNEHVRDYDTTRD